MNTKRIAIFIPLYLLGCLLLGAQALADAPDDYLFGTTLVLTSPVKLGDSWTDQLPSAYMYSIGSIIDAVNAARTARGEKTQVDVKTYPINEGGEMARGDKWEYTVTFQWMSPKDVDVVLKKFPFTGKLAGVPHVYKPLQRAVYDGVQSADGTSATLDLLGTTITATYDTAFSVIRAQVAAALAKRFGARAKFDLSMDNYVNAGGTYPATLSLTVTVYLDGAEKQELTGEGEAP